MLHLFTCHGRVMPRLAELLFRRCLVCKKATKNFQICLFCKLKKAENLPCVFSPLMVCNISGSARTTSSGSQFSSLPTLEPSPVGYPPAMPINSMTAVSGGSVFQPNSVNHSRRDSLTRKLSLDPYERVKVDKLNSVSILYNPEV